MLLLVNLTPHAISIYANGVVAQTVPASGQVARLSVVTEKGRDLFTAESAVGIPTSVSHYGEPENIPAPENNVVFIVSQLVKAAFPARTDLATPGPLVRNDKGEVIGCNGLSFAW